VAGLVLSAVLDLPSGAMIVWTLAGCGVLARLLRVAGANGVAATAHSS